MKKFYILLLFYSFCTSLIGCNNSYERKLIGTFYLDKVNTKKKSVQLDSSILILSKNRSFSLQFKNKKIVGRWEAYDDGDNVWVSFDFGNKIVNASAGGDDKSLNYIRIFSPADFGYGELLNLDYKKR